MALRSTRTRTHVRRTPFWQSALLIGAVCIVVQAAGCPCSKDVKQVRIQVRDLQVAGGESFTLLAELRDKKGCVVPESEGDDVEWSITPATGLLTEAAQPTLHSIVLQSTTVTLAAPTPVTVHAWVGGHHAPDLRVTILPPPAGDRIASTHLPKALPSFALLLGAGGSTNCPVSEFAGRAFVSLGSLDDLVGGCTGPAPGEVALFSMGKAAMFSTLGWTTSANLLNFAPTGPPFAAEAIRASLGPPYSLPLTFWFAADETDLTDTEIDELIRGRLERAGEALDSSLVGIGFSAAGVQFLGDYSASLSLGDRQCTSTVQDLKANGIDPNEFKLDKLNVVFVSHVYLGVGEFQGWRCEVSTDHGALVLISWKDQDETTLTHELGHLLSLTHAPLDYTNAMRSIFDAKRPGARTRFTIGQGFRMVVEQASWVNRNGASPTRPSTEPQRDCVNQLCPALTQDIRPGGEP